MSIVYNYKVKSVHTALLSGGEAKLHEDFRHHLGTAVAIRGGTLSKRAIHGNAPHNITLPLGIQGLAESWLCDFN